MFGINLDDYLLEVEGGVSFKKKESSYFVLSIDHQSVIELKDVAFSIWKNLQKPISFHQLLDKIKQEYDVSEEKLEKDLKSWLKEALRERIVKKTKIK